MIQVKINYLTVNTIRYSLSQQKCNKMLVFKLCFCAKVFSPSLFIFFTAPRCRWGRLKEVLQLFKNVFCKKWAFPHNSDLWALRYTSKINKNSQSSAESMKMTNKQFNRHKPGFQLQQDDSYKLSAEISSCSKWSVSRLFLFKQDFQTLKIFRPKTLENCWSSILRKFDFLGENFKKIPTGLLLLITQS